MKLVATSAFRVTPGVTFEMEGKQLAPNHVHKGARFSIAGNEPFEQLNRVDKEFVVGLNRVGRIVEPENAEAVQTIDAEVISEKSRDDKREAALKKLHPHAYA